LKKEKPGDDLLSHHEGSTIGVEELNFRVRNGNGCGLFTIVTRQNNQKERGKMAASWDRHAFTAAKPRKLTGKQYVPRQRVTNQIARKCMFKKVKDNMVKPHGRLVLVD
jgi:hypothetical protein